MALIFSIYRTGQWLDELLAYSRHVADALTATGEALEGGLNTCISQALVELGKARLRAAWVLEAVHNSNETRLLSRMLDSTNLAIAAGLGSRSRLDLHRALGHARNLASEAVSMARDLADDPPAEVWEELDDDDTADEFAA